MSRTPIEFNILRYNDPVHVISCSILPIFTSHFSCNTCFDITYIMTCCRGYVSSSTNKNLQYLAQVYECLKGSQAFNNSNWHRFSRFVLTWKTMRFTLPLLNSIAITMTLMSSTSGWQSPSDVPECDFAGSTCVSAIRQTQCCLEGFFCTCIDGVWSSCIQCPSGKNCVQTTDTNMSCL